MSIIYTLWLRQLIKYLRSRSRIIGTLAQPLLFLVAFGFGFGPVFEQAGEGDYLTFLIPGIIAMTVLFTAVFSGIDLIWDRQFGFLRETLVAPVSRFQIVLGKTLGGATVATIQGVILFLITLLIGFRPYRPILLILALVFLFLIAILFTSLGVLIASLVNDLQGFQLIINFLVMPIFFLSGALFPLDNLPPILVLTARLNPLSYGVDALRTLLIAVSQYNLFLDTIVLVTVIFALLAIGSYLFSRLEV